MRKAKPDSMATRVLEVIQQNPGVNVGYISEQLNADPKQVKGAVAFHRSEGRIINRGKAARGAKWYPNYAVLENPDNGKESMPEQDWREALRSPTPVRGACRKCGAKPTVARIMLTAQEKVDGDLPGGGQKFNNIASKTTMLCANCIAGVYKTVEASLLEEIGESE